MIVLFIALSLAVFAAVAVFWRAWRAAATDIAGRFDAAATAATSSTASASAKRSGTGPAHVAVGSEEWTALDELQLIRLLTDSES